MQMKIQNAFRLGLLGMLGAGLGLLLLGMVASLATIITYIGIALFLALGLEPMIAWLERKRVPRWAAILIVMVGVTGVFVGLIFAILPVIVQQTTILVNSIATGLNAFQWQDVKEWVDTQLAAVGMPNAWNNAIQFLSDPKSIVDIAGGALQVGASIAGGLFGAIIVLILTLYFAASLNSMKRSLYQLVPASRRARFADISEQVTSAVGRFVMGQVTLALCNGVLSFIYLSIIGAKLAAVFAFLAFMFSLIPLVGTISGSVIIVLSQLLLASPATAIAAGIYYVIYMQVEAYVLSPNIMSRAVAVPGSVVVIAALAGGTLLGVLGALIAIPVAASIILIIKQVVIPRQDEL